MELTHKDYLYMDEVNQLISYAIKEGYLDDSAEEWSDQGKQDYFNRCQMLS